MSAGFYLKASVDGTKQSTSGPSYPSSSDSPEDLGFNVGAIFMGLPPNPEEYRSSSLNFNGQRTLYAADNLNPASLAFDNSGAARQQIVNTTNNNFVSHLNYMGGLEFVLKRSGGDGIITNMDYLEVPLYGLYQARFMSGSVFGGLGPYFAYGIGGNTTATFDGHSSSVKTFDSTTGFKRFDAGLGFTAGYRLPNSFYFNLEYSLGIANIDRSTFGDKTRNSGISLNVGYPIDRLIKHGNK